jgi:hypothetical protein
LLLFKEYRRNTEAKQAENVIDEIMNSIDNKMPKRGL